MPLPSVCMWTSICFLLQTWSTQVFAIGLDKYEISVFTKNSTGFPRFAAYLKYHHTTKFEQLSDLVVVDRPHRAWRFQIIYSLLSVHWAVRLRLNTLTDELQPLHSLSPLFAGANWLEREAWDLFGVGFDNHPDLRRILTDYGFSGHPLRKDFPMSGFREVFYSARHGRIISRPVSFAQEWRTFRVLNTWVKH